MEAWDVVVLGDGPAALRAAAEAARGGASTLMMSTTALGQPGLSALDGLSASIQENNPRSHREDTIRCGAFLSDQDIVAETTTMAIKQVDLLERRGVNYRRDLQGLPMVRRAIGHAQPRTTDAGSSTSLQVQQVGEEQAMRHGVVRRGDQIPLTLVHSDQSVDGLVVLDMVNGRVIGLQCKALIVADEGFEGAFGDGTVGLGMDIAFRAGMVLRDMEFMTHHPLMIEGTNVMLPTGLLLDGAVLHEATGAELELGATPLEMVRAVQQAVQPVLDARNLGDAAPWWASTFRLVKQRTGVDMARQTVPISHTVGHTIGGLPVDKNGRCVTGSWARWFTGLYAAGDASCSGLHGTAALPGNRLLDALCTGTAAGTHAAEWTASQTFATTENLSEAVDDAKRDLSAMLDDTDATHVVRCGTLTASLQAALASTMSLSQTSLQNLMVKLEGLEHQAESLHVDQTSLFANTNLLEVFRTQAAIRMVMASVRSGLAREESRGSFVREDYPDANDDFLHHITVDQKGTIGTLALKKGTGGHWLLTPQ